MWSAVTELAAQGLGLAAEAGALLIAQPQPSTDTNAVPYVLILLLGFVVGAYGHAAKNRWLIVAGIGLIILAIVLFQVEIVTKEPDYLPPGV